MVLRGAGRAIGGQPERHLLRVLRSLPTLAGRLGRAELVRPVLAIGPLSYRATAMSADGALLVGDAGGFYDPFTGQGVHRALVSAALAARVALDALAAGDLSLEHLRAYDRRRRAHFRANHAVE